MSARRRAWSGVAVAAVVIGWLTMPATRAALPEGSLDPTFGIDGTIVDTSPPPGASGEYIPHAAIVDGRGRLWVAGDNDQDTWYVARYLANGARDHTFGSDGVTSFAFPSMPIAARAVSLAFDPQGGVVVAGYDDYNGGSVSDMARLDDNGKPVTSWHTPGLPPGVITFDPTAPNRVSGASAVAVLPNGDIIVGGGASSDIFVARFLPTGKLDQSFGINGYARTNLGQQTFLSALSVLPDGRILTAGTVSSGTDDQIAVARWTKNGILDTTFNGGAGTQATTIGSADRDYGQALTVLPDGSFVVGGIATWANEDQVVVKFHKNGGVDTSWAEAGHRAIDRSSTYEAVTSIVRQPDGKLVLGGYYDASPYKLSVIRLLPDGDLDPAFNGTGEQSVDFVAAETSTAIYHGRILAVTTTRYGSSSTTVGIAGFIGDSTAPSRARLAPLPHIATANVRLRPHAADDNSGVARYRLSRQQAGYRTARFGGSKAWRVVPARRHTKLPVSPGATVCVAARAVDAAGNVGRRGAATCTAFPVDDTAAKQHGLWTRLTSHRYYRHTALSTTHRGAILRLPVAYGRLELLASTCSTCGSVRVYLGHSRLRTVTLRSRHAHNRVLLPLATSKTLRRGTLRLVVRSRQGTVTIDGFAVSAVR